MEKFVEKPWGWEKWIELNDKYCMKVIHINKGQRLSLQYHEKKLETLYVMEGYGKFYLDNEEIYALPGVFITVHPGQHHRSQASQKNSLTIIEASTIEVDDVVRISDDYNRNTESE